VIDFEPFSLALLLAGLVGLAALLSHRLTERVKVPTPAFLLVAAAIAVKVVPELHAPSEQAVERIVSVALMCILFDGGMHIGWSRFRAAAGPIAAIGLAGTVVTVAGLAPLVRYGLGLSWYAAILLSTAVAPTDPAVVFSVLGQREVAGRAGTILEGESGANDPVGIALMASLISAGSLTGDSIGAVAGKFFLQMGVGLVIGVAVGGLLLQLMRRVALPSEGLYPLRTLSSVLAIFGVATLAHGSGFLAVFVAGILVGDRRAPFKREIRQFHGALASLAEVIAFTVLGLTVEVAEIARLDVWLPGILLGGALAFVVRPLLVYLCLLPAHLERNERAFVLLSGLKGAVPILLGSYLLSAHVADTHRLYGIVVVIVVFSVVVQGSMVPSLAARLALPMRTTEVAPWSLGVQLRHQPEGVHRFSLTAGAPAEGVAIEELPSDIWVSSVVRNGHLLRVRAQTRLKAGDEVLIFADADRREELCATFETIESGPFELS
jgi:potassium/hydrogen antiporter